MLYYLKTCNSTFSSVQLLSRVWLFATPWITARQASLSITSSQSSLRLMSIESVMPSSHLILCRPLLLLPPIPPSISLCQWVNSSHEVAKELEFQLQHHSFQTTSDLIVNSQVLAGITDRYVEFLQERVFYVKSFPKSSVSRGQLESEMHEQRFKERLHYDQMR